MIKNIKITIHSIINDLEENTPIGDAEINDISVKGTLRETDGEIILSYREDSEGGSVLTRISVKDGHVTVTRQGAISSVMVFAEGETFNTLYEIAPYKFNMSIRTVRMKCELDAEGGLFDVSYRMNVGGAEKLCRMKLSAEETSQ